jgi:hypothetical protein
MWNLHDNLNKSVLAYSEWFYMNFKMADVWNLIPERSVGRLKKDLLIDTTFDPPLISLDSPIKHHGVISMTLRYIFASSLNTLTLLKSIITYIIYHFDHISAVIASYSYCNNLIDQWHCSIRYLFSIIMYLLFTSPIPLSKELEGDLKLFLRNPLQIHEICTLKTRFSIKSRRQK